MMPSSYLSKSTVFAQLSSNATPRLLSSSTGDQALQNSSYIGRELGAGNKLKAYQLDEEDCSAEQLSGGADHEQQKNIKMEGAAAAISGGGGAAGSGEEQDPDNQLQPPSKKSKRYHRHTAFQIQQLESFFKECAHPDEKQRQELSEALGLSVRQVKFWFQNRRTQMKAQQERSDNAHLRAENERLRTENITIREAIKHASCPTCGTGPSTSADVAFDEQQLRMENLRLREELEHITMVATRYFGRPIPQLGRSISNVLPGSSLEMGAEINNVATSSVPTILAADQHHHDHDHQHHHQYQQPIGLVEQAATTAIFHESRPVQQQHSPTLLEIALRPGGISEMEKAAVAELAMGAVQEVLQVAHAQEPLWIQDNNSNASRLDTDMYFKQFPGGIGPRPPGLSTEATRDTGLVIMNSLTLLDALMDVNKWMEMFPSIISKGLTVEVLSPGIPPTLDGALQLMYAELQVLSPLVRTREIYFLRYCKQAADKLWVMVDVSIDCLRDNPPPCLLQCRRRPSGCIIQDMPNGYSQVTWLEHLETDQHDVNPLYSSLVGSGTAFGAKRWLCTLQRYCENLASLLATNIPARDLGVVNSLEGRRCMLRLAQRMTNRYVANVSASSTSNWVSANGAGPTSATTGGLNKGSSTSINIAAAAADHEDVRVMTRDNPGDGVLLCAATSTWLPFSRQRVFDFLRNERFRAQWDVLANGPTQEMIHIAKGQHPGNSVSLLRVNGSSPSQSNVLILQESSTDDSGSLVVYMPVDFSTVTRVLQGEDPSDVLMLLPSGFVILPDGPTESTIDADITATTDGIHNNNNDIDAAPPADDPSSSSSSTPHLIINKPATSTGGGSLLTVSFQIAVSHVPSSGKLNMDSVNTVSNIILTTLQHIKTALQHWDH